MKGEALLWASITDQPGVAEVLQAALDQHLATGASMDEILGLRGAQGQHSPGGCYCVGSVMCCWRI